MPIAIKDNRKTFGLGSILLHWITALIIIGMYPLGLYIGTLTYYDADYHTVPYWHKSIGMILLGLVVLRVLWRIANTSPAPLPQPQPLLLATKAAHLLLYLLTLIALVSGYMISTADGRGIEVFNWFEIPALPAVTKNQEDIAGEIHYIAATLLVSLAAIHALAALKHHFIDKDKTLTRMINMRQETNP
ncbi:cytochrome b [Amphritea sp.]|uniref:cytochrome b n=1 Tax=Amphritea sp. TaxID=1872502 RepID=UPI003D0CCA12